MITETIEASLDECANTCDQVTACYGIDFISATGRCRLHDENLNTTSVRPITETDEEGRFLCLERMRNNEKVAIAKIPPDFAQAPSLSGSTMALAYTSSKCTKFVFLYPDGNIDVWTMKYSQFGSDANTDNEEFNIVLSTVINNIKDSGFVITENTLVFYGENTVQALGALYFDTGMFYIFAYNGLFVIPVGTGQFFRPEIFETLITGTFEPPNEGYFATFFSMIWNAGLFTESPVIVDSKLYCSHPLGPRGGISVVDLNGTLGYEIGELVSIGNTSQYYNGIVASGRYLYALTYVVFQSKSELHKIDIDSGVWEVLVNSFEDKPIIMNDLVMLENGDLIITGDTDDVVYRFSNGELTKMFDMPHPNGVEIDEERGNLWLTDSRNAVLVAYSMQTNTSTVKYRFETGAEPDGICRNDKFLFVTSGSMRSETNYKRYIMIYDLENDRVFDYIDIRQTPINCEVHESGLYVTTGGSVQLFNLAKYNRLPKVDETGLSDKYQIRHLIERGEYMRQIVVNKYGDVLLFRDENIEIYTGFGDEDYYGPQRTSRAVVLTPRNENLELLHTLIMHDKFVLSASTSAVYAWSYDDSTPENARRPFNNTITLVQGIDSTADIGGGDTRRNNHRTRSMIFDREGNLYIQIGSRYNVDPTDQRSLIRKMSKEQVHEALHNGKTFEWLNLPVFARGLRNSVDLALDPDGKIWVVNMGADELLVEGYTKVPPDEYPFHEDNPVDTLYRLDPFNSVRSYGYPECYVSGNVLRGPDGTIYPKKSVLAWVDDDTNPDTILTNEECQDVTRVVPPVMGLGGHVSPIGAVFSIADSSNPNKLAFDGKHPTTLQKNKKLTENSLFVTFKGSWNREEPNGYAVVRIPFEYKSWKRSGQCKNITSLYRENGCCASSNNANCEASRHSFYSQKCCREFGWSPMKVSERRSNGTLIESFDGDGVIDKILFHPSWADIDVGRPDRFRPTGLTFDLQGNLLVASNLGLYEISAR
jgi:hypothetical protein